MSAQRRRRPPEPSLLANLRGGPGHAGPRSAHFDGREFHNPDRSTAPKGLAEFLRWQRTRTPARWPAHVENRARPQLPESVEPGALALTFVNHITFLAQLAGLNVLTDPVWSERVSPLAWSGPRRVREPGLAFERLPRIDLVLVSHNHYDHLDIATLQRLEAAHAPTFVTGLGNGPFLRKDLGLGTVHELDWWQELRIGRARLVFTPAQHWSGRGPGNRNCTLWGGFLVEAAGFTLYFAGDTGFGAHFAEVRRRREAQPVDLALLPIGAYAPRWFMRNQHMDPEDAVLAHRALGAAQSVGTHFGCFQLTDEPIDEPVQRLAEARRRHRLHRSEFDVLETGETRAFRAANRAVEQPRRRRSG